MIILLKYCADVENCESFRGDGFIYILVKGPCVARFYYKINRIYVKIIIITK